MKRNIQFLFFVLVIAGMVFAYMRFSHYSRENKILKEVISRLEADSRAAEILVSNVRFDERNKKNITTIKFLEYDVKGKPLTPQYFSFPGNIIQFQSLVIRFDDIHIRNKDALRGKSAYLFWKVFMLDGKDTLEYEITKANSIPVGYKIEGLMNPFEEKLWSEFWSYALNPKEAGRLGIKNAQIEAPGTMFVPGSLYTIKIEHDGGLRIDANPLPEILKGERIPSDSEVQKETPIS